MMGPVWGTCWDHILKIKKRREERREKWTSSESFQGFRFKDNIFMLKWCKVRCVHPPWWLQSMSFVLLCCCCCFLPGVKRKLLQSPLPRWCSEEACCMTCISVVKQGSTTPYTRWSITFLRHLFAVLGICLILCPCPRIPSCLFLSMVAW